ncbi:Glycosyltransferase involved in cell wall bisynthesis [Chitinophaga terrae (ex Kim and Jung 2007)]|uniref:Glycosyltransferase involved in cell wall bisynthesis n=1 Tax=Chitinophaga terrae (ex Kim and Jung 2007) TaxID=408074 RepID=A0A1H4AII2_9BACT|nr:glycosyltransferase family 2 protein [Chitinophaga terrae (ex Kim and Jung 2007)]GEP89316.1 glycosyl transferase [Chitinophaga terrae (ex Kim and Jung 2007)]SEA35715.1 Glycosyltransferase involved in cell wall bisynthesis [Chitinophaga terrae (ex Kim and Jung 2007)]
MSHSANPVVSIITVCYNAGKYIEATIKSVLAQTYPHIEYVIVDGASKDNTLEVIAPYRSKIHTLISEKDKGLYDAMNKGMKAATGEYLLFLNADDVLADENVISNMMQTCHNADVYYGEAMFMDEEGKDIGLRSEQTPHKVPEQLTWKSLKYGMVVSHQAFIVRRSLSPLYDLQYKVCADIDWMIRCLKNAEDICNTHIVVARFRVGGTSKQRQQLAWKERYRILSHFYGHLPNFMHHLFIGMRYFFSKRY